MFTRIPKPSQHRNRHNHVEIKQAFINSCTTSLIIDTLDTSSTLTDNTTLTFTTQERTFLQHYTLGYYGLLFRINVQGYVIAFD